MSTLCILCFQHLPCFRSHLEPSPFFLRAARNSGNRTCSAALDDGSCPAGKSLRCPIAAQRIPDDVAVTNGGVKNYDGLFNLVDNGGLPASALATPIEVTVVVTNGGQLEFPDTPSVTIAVSIQTTNDEVIALLFSLIQSWHFAHDCYC